MWQRFTERARRAVFFAQEEAAMLGTVEVGVEHLLLGLLRDPDSVGCKLLAALEVNRTHLREQLLILLPRGQGDLSVDMQLTPTAKHVIDCAYEEARRLNNNYIGTEHLLLGIALREDTLAARTLAAPGANVNRLRDAVSRLPSPGSGPQNKLPVLETPWTDLYRVLSTATAAAGVVGEAEVSLECLFRASLIFGTLAAQTLGNAGFQMSELTQVLRARNPVVTGATHRKAVFGTETRTLIARLFVRFAAKGGTEPDSRDLLLELLEEPDIQALQGNIPIDLQKMRAVLEKGSN